MRGALKADALGYCSAEIVKKVTEEKAQEVLKIVKENCGVENVLRESNLDDAGRVVVQGALSMLESGLTSAIAGIASDAVAKIVNGTPTKFGSRDEAKEAMAKEVPDTINNLINVMARSYLTGSKWDSAKKDFVKVAGAKDRLQSVCDNFKIPYETSSGDQSANDAKDLYK